MKPHEVLDDTPTCARDASFAHAKVRAGIEDGHRAANLDGAARTLRASYRSGWTVSSEFVRCGDGAARFYTCREAARLMGFPDDFVIPGHHNGEGSATASEEYFRFYHQIGNSVCLPVIRALAESILTALALDLSAGPPARTPAAASREMGATEAASSAQERA